MWFIISNIYGGAMYENSWTKEEALAIFKEYELDPNEEIKLIEQVGKKTKVLKKKSS